MDGIEQRKKTNLPCEINISDKKKEQEKKEKIDRNEKKVETET